MSRYLGFSARVVLLIVALSIIPAVAHADFVYTVTSTNGVSTQFSFIEPTIASSGDVTSSFTQISGATVVEFQWASGTGTGSCAGLVTACTIITFPGANSVNDFGFSVPSFLTLGTYTSSFGTTVNIAQTPEPSSLLLLGTGIFGLLGAIRRKRA